MKFILSLFFVVSFAFAQPTISPSSVNVTYDLAKDTLVQLPDITISNTGSSAFVYNTVVNNYQSNVLIWPVQSVVPAGTTGIVKVAVVANSLAVGTYNIPVTFVQAPSSGNVSLSLGINLTVIDSRNFTISTDPTISHIASGDGWTTTVKLTNTSSSLSLATLKFYDPLGINSPFYVNGYFVSEFSVVIPAFGSTDVVLSDPNSLKTGSLDVRTVFGTGVVAQATYSTNAFEATISSSIPNKDSFNISFDNTGRKSTGVAIVNALNYPQEVTFTFYDNLGNVFYTDKIIMLAKGQVALTLDTAFSSTKGKSGTLKIQTTRPSLTGFGLKFNLDKGYFTVSSIF